MGTVELSLNSSTQESTKGSPSRLVYRSELQLPIDIVMCSTGNVPIAQDFLLKQHQLVNSICYLL